MSLERTSYFLVERMMQLWRALLLSGIAFFYGETVVCESDNKAPTWVIQDIQKTDDDIRVLVKIGDDDAVHPGTYLNATRHAPQGMQKSNTPFVRTGVLQVEEIYQNIVFAKVIGEQSPESQYLFPHYPGIMIGDFIEPHGLDIKRHIELLPTYTISYFDLFIDPTDYPETFELSESGKTLLKKLASRFASARVPLLMIEGHTDAAGRSETNQIESYQRAMTIKQFLVNDMAFDKERLVALGLGESEPLAGGDLPGAERKARRIVLKVKEKVSR
jgi:hypothetical protein